MLTKNSQKWFWFNFLLLWKIETIEILWCDRISIYLFSIFIISVWRYWFWSHFWCRIFDEISASFFLCVWMYSLLSFIKSGRNSVQLLVFDRTSCLHFAMISFNNFQLCEFSFLACRLFSFLVAICTLQCVCMDCLHDYMYYKLVFSLKAAYKKYLEDVTISAPCTLL